MQKLQIFSIVATAGTFVLVFELVRRRRLMERYALMWLFSAATLFVLAAWQGLLNSISRALGIVYGTSLLFALVFAFVLVLLMHFSLVISRLADQNKVLAQRLGLMQHRVAVLEAKAREDTREDEPEFAGISGAAARR